MFQQRISFCCCQRMTRRTRIFFAYSVYSVVFFNRRQREKTQKLFFLSLSWTIIYFCAFLRILRFYLFIWFVWWLSFFAFFCVFCCFFNRRQLEKTQKLFFLSLSWTLYISAYFCVFCGSIFSDFMCIFIFVLSVGNTITMSDVSRTFFVPL